MDINDIPHTRGNSIRFFTSYITKHASSLKGKRIYDLSAGSGYIARLFTEKGGKVSAYDLFPEHNAFSEIDIRKIDLQYEFPIEDKSADVVILSETFEHLPNQFHFFKETERVLDTNGILIITTPNTSSLRSRFSQFVTESEHYSNPLPDETTAFVTWPGTTDGYFNKIFISGILRIRVLAAINGLEIRKIHKSQFTSTSFLLLIFYPFILFFSWKNLRRQLKLSPENYHIYHSIYKLNTSFRILLSKHLIIEFLKK
ncbi:MAG: class I SAM-dependent methyltransferase [Saprospiraceae bacterium]|nr:class I SAM-dependent methyltransferase [Saprospiraceae bacterium]